MKNILIIFIFFVSIIYSQDEGAFRIARLKYNGGGDWYNDPSAEVNLLKYVQEKFKLKVKPEYVFVEANSNDIFLYPFLFITGHGNISFSDSEVKRLRTYLDKGGFIYIDDDYGLDKAIRREFKKIYPEKDFYELPFNHPIYNIAFKFPNGVPKTHEHDDKPTKGFAISDNNRVVVFYTYESNPSDGWADPEVHNDPPEKRIEALNFGVNLILYSLTY
jgi:hypothetical protein